MRREELTLDDGLICLSINGKSETIFNPTDIGFVEKVFNCIEAMDGKQEYFEKRMRNAEPHEVFQIAREADAEMRELLDGVMGAGTCAAQFGNVSVYAYADGLPLWANMLFAIVDRCEGDIVKQQKLTHSRLEKYTSKYHK